MSRADAERVSPHNTDAERSVLGAILVKNAWLDEIATTIVGGSFFSDHHRRIFNGMLRLVDQRVPVDFVTLKTEMQRTGELEEVGGPAYLASLADGMLVTSNVPHYARIVAECAQRREIIRVATEAMADAYAGELGPDDALAKADAAFMELRGYTGTMTSFRAMSAAGFARLEERMKLDGAITGVPTGFAGLDMMLQGWQPGNLYFIAARPSMGKTSLAVNSGVRAAIAGHRGVVFSMEMTKEELHDRGLSELSQVPLARIKSAVLGERDWARITHGFEAMHAAEFHVDEAPRRTPDDIRTACRRLLADGPLKLVIVDYIQMMGLGGKQRRDMNRSQELGAIGYRLKDIAKELRVPMVVLSQLARLPPNERPQLHHLRESGDLEQAADVVIMLWRRHYNEGGLTELLIRKARNNATGVVYAMFDAETTTFTHADPPATVEPEPDEAPPPKKRYANKQRRLGV